MAKEIRTVIWCDGPNHLDDEQVEAVVTRRFAADTLKEHEIDLCEICDKEIAQPLLDLLTEHGQPVKGAKPIKGLPQVEAPTPRETRPRRAAEVKCPVEDCDWAGTLTAAGQHTPRAHGGVVLPILEGRHGRRLLDGSRVTLDYPCPECEAAYDTKGGLAGHKVRAHS